MSDYIPELNMQKMVSGALKVTAITAVTAGALIFLANFIGHTDKKGDEEAVNARIQPVAKVELAAAGAAAAAGNRSGEEIYKATCAACHDTGAAGAPKMGDKGAWGPRLGQGLAGLVKSATAGKNAMPPKGGSDATPEELARVIAYMTNKSGANFSAK
jgi:cytochrome c5